MATKVRHESRVHLIAPWADQSTQAVIAELRSALTLHEETIQNLRERGHRVVADRDKWEALINTLNQQLADQTKTLTKQAAKITELSLQLGFAEQQLTERADAIARLEQTVSDLQNQLKARPNGNSNNNDKFATAKRRFAKMYHPDNNNASGIDKDSAHGNL